MSPLHRPAAWFGSVAAFGFLVVAAAVPAAAAVFPTVTGAGSIGGSPSVTSYNVNIARRYDATGTLLSTIASTGIVTTTGGAGVGEAGLPIRAIDGHTDLWKLQSTIASDPNATGILRLTLDQLYDINRITHLYHGAFVPESYSIRVSSTGFGSMNTVASNVALGASTTTWTDTFATQSVKFIEYQMTGIRAGASSFAMLSELQVFAADTASPPPDSNSGYNIIALGSPTITISEPGVPPATSKWNGGAATLARVINLDDRQAAATVLGANSAGTPGFGNAVAVIDLGAIHHLTDITINNFLGQGFLQGGTLQISADNVVYHTVFDTNSQFLSGNYAVGLPKAQKFARFIRVINKNAMFNQSSWIEVQAFGATLPEPASIGLVSLAAVGLLMHRPRLRV